MSVSRSFAQRDNNVNKIVPVFIDTFDFEPRISGCSHYNLSVPNAQFVKGQYYVDMSGVDTSGNLIDLSGQFYSSVDEGLYINTVCFSVEDPVNPAVYPGLEFTITFKNIPYNRITEIPIPLLTIGLIKRDSDPVFPYILSPPFPPLLAPNSVNVSVTFKSDGENFNVVSSGPAGWLGAPVLNSILSYYTGLIPG
jgi:hypothetical protein